MDFRLITLFLIASVILTRVVYAQPSDAPDEPAATQPAATQPATSPATQPAAVSPDAQAVLERVRAAYAKLRGLEVAGTYALELDVAGQRQNKESKFTGSFKAPDRFRHEMTDDALVVGGPGAGPARGGDAKPRAYLYVPGTGKYAEADAPAGRSALMASHEPYVDVLRGQNPSLYLALCEDASAELTDDVKTVTKLPHERIGQTECEALRLENDEIDVDVLIDRSSSLLRQVRFDMAKSVAARGVPDVKRARITIDYTTSSPDVSPADATFAWSPPADATLARAPAAGGADEPGEGEAQALVGKPAPDFALENLAGETISMRDLHGSVVVLDFWATWCPPCRESMPGLDKLNREFTDAGVRVFAVNLREDKEQVQQFLADAKLTLPVLLDATGKVAERYGVSGIPQTVVVDKKGTVTRVIVGFSPETDAKLREAVRSANGVR